tara:strand:- start:1417 stop:3183 length:1767 start_codon:yes stop_codon:yes gene_type:complete
MSFWSATDKIPVLQKSVRLPSINGTSYNAGQEIRLHIPDNIKFFNPQATFIEADVTITPPTYVDTDGSGAIKPARLQLDAQTGFSSLIRAVRIHDRNGVLLEEYDHYNTWVALKYDYHTNPSLKGKRALTEGSTTYNINSRGTEGTAKSDQNDYLTNPYFLPATTGTQSASFTSAKFVKAKCVVPLHTGIMSNSKLFMNGMIGGITITLLMEENRYPFRQIESNMLWRKVKLNAKFLGVTAVGGSLPDSSTTKNTIYLEEVNSQVRDASKCNFVVGQKFGIFQATGASAGSKIAFTGGVAPEISAITYDSASHNIYLTTKNNIAVNGSGALPSRGDYYLYDRSVLDATSYNPTYHVENVNIVIQEVSAPAQFEAEMMRRMKEGGTINYDFTTQSTYLYSQLATDRVANIRLPIENERCKAILCVPTDATPYDAQQILNASTTYKIELEGNAYPNYYLRSNRPNLEGIVDFATTYQWFYDGRLQPARQVNLDRVASKEAISAVQLLELDKALASSGITGHSLSKFRDNFVIGRALGLNDMTYDARNKDFSLQINYQSVTSAPTKAKLWKCFVTSIRRLEVSSNGIRVIV